VPARSALVGFGLLLGACASSGAVKLALYGDLPALRQEIARAERAGELDRGSVTRLADAVARRELAAAKGESGARRVRQLRACTAALSDALGERADASDEVAAEAVLALLAQRRLESDSLVAAYQDATDGAWRSVAARAATSSRDVDRRRRWFIDPDQRVRRAAFEAAFERPDPGDLQHALEAVRLDPDPLVQSLAARVAGAIGGEESVLGLRDRFERADESSRLGIIDAWAMPKSFRTGGERELRRALERDLDVASVAAARALLDRGQRDAAIVGVIEHGIRQGADAARRLAVSIGPLSEPTIVEALLSTSKDADPSISAISLERVAALPKHRENAFRELRSRARVRGAAGDDARAALSRLGDRSIVKELAADVKSAGPWRRQAAALELFDLGQPALTARALADPDPGVRTNVACGVLSRQPQG
jgi:hypothetical protein